MHCSPSRKTQAVFAIRIARHLFPTEKKHRARASLDLDADIGAQNPVVFERETAILGDNDRLMIQECNFPGYARQGVASITR